MSALNENISISIGRQYSFSTIILFFFIALLYTVQDIIGYETVSMILLLVIFMLPLFNFSRGPIILAAVISALGWDYYFIPPHFTMHIAKTEDVVMLVMFFTVASTNGVLSAKLNRQKHEMIIRERKLESLFEVVKVSAKAKNLTELMDSTIRQVGKVFGTEIVFFCPDNPEQLNRDPYPKKGYDGDDIEWLAADASFKMKVPTGKSTDIVANAEAVYFPVLDENNQTELVMGIKISDEVKSDKNELEFLKNYINEVMPFFKKFSVSSAV